MAIPNSVTTIGAHAFVVCKSLTSVVIPNSITTIGEEVFSGCESLTSVAIPGSVTIIGEEAFLFTSLTSVTLSQRTKVPEDVFPKFTTVYRD